MTRSEEMSKMKGNEMKEQSTKENPWLLKTFIGTSEYMIYRDETVNPPLLVCVVGSADEQERHAEGTVEASARSPENPVKGWYGLKKGLRGRFGMYLPPLMEALGLAEVEHNPKNNRMRVI
jgi:hypothetical protein